MGGIPDIGIQNLENGEYASQFHQKLVDSFPGKETLSTWNREFNRLYSFTGFSGEDEVQMLVPIVNDGPDHGAHVTDLESTTTPTENIPESEAEAESTVASSEETEEITEILEIESTQPQEEPEAEALGQILLMGDRAMELPVADYNAIAKYSASVSAIAQALEGVNVYNIIVPNSAGIYAPSAYQQGDDSQKAMIDFAYSSIPDSVNKVDAYSVLQEHKEEEIYFRTDHHWTHLGSYYAYTAFCEEAGLTAQPVTAYESGTYETFLGTMYSFLSGYSQRSILRDNPDSLTYYIPDRETTVRYYESGNLSYGGKIDLIYSLSADYSNKYICFLGGDHPVTVIETDHPEERVCLLIKESYGNAFSTWLTEHYSKIICIDPREFNRNEKPSLDLVKFAEGLNIDDCIILNYPLMINSSAYSAWLGRLVE